MSSMKLEEAKKLHTRSLDVAKRYLACEIELIEILAKHDETKAFYVLNYDSLFHYATQGLGLPHEVAYIFINVARKTREVPALKQEIKAGTITVSKARRMTSVLTPENQSHWLKLAKTSSKKELEKQVALSNPKVAVQEKTQYSLEPVEKVKVLNLPEIRVQWQVGVSDELMLQVRRAQDVLSQKLRRPASSEETLKAMAALYLFHEDPLEKAKRQKIKGKLQCPGTVFDDAASENPPQAPVPAPVPSREKPTAQLSSMENPKATPQRRKPIQARARHQLQLKHEGRCDHVDENGRRCINRRFLEIHHVIPVSQGGTNDLNNLRLLCSGHHRLTHEKRE